jgi:hypothetical protein
MTNLLSPGSYNEFIASNPDLDREQALRAWEQKLIVHREVLAGSMGISLDDLHGDGLSSSDQLVRIDGGDSE